MSDAVIKWAEEMPRETEGVNEREGGRAGERKEEMKGWRKKRMEEGM